MISLKWSWTPNRHAVKALGLAIRSHFEGPYHHYEAVPEDVQVRWWTEFKTRVTWTAQDEWQIKKVYETKVKKRLSDMLTKARDKRKRPHWIGEQAWVDLLIYWVTDKKFKDQSAQNKINRTSSRGGAVHTTGRKYHLDIAVGLERKYGKPVDPDVLFLATHKNKDGRWVDDRARDTYEKYHERLRVAQSQNAKGSTDDTGAMKLQCWKDAAGGKTRGRCYGTEDLASNIRRGVSCLTQETLLDPHTSHAHQHSAEAKALRQQVQQAIERADVATTGLVEANQRYALLEEQMQLMQEQLQMVLDRRSRGS
ncbi:hypothetical protein D0Y65_053357 [Glycine soja]|uniref:Uncharacterized protein n=1 Tax=Glycine soja TaxID=3848 RepID=A0A445F1T8_GLYSO|nr:hypothetical protein D0Y65_053357 [Glycine soja]